MKLFITRQTFVYDIQDTTAYILIDGQINISSSPQDICFIDKVLGSYGAFNELTTLMRDRQIHKCKNYGRYKNKQINCYLVEYEKIYELMNI